MTDCKKLNEVLSELNTNPNGKTLLKISTSWCGPCRVLKNTIDELEGSIENVKFISVDADEADQDVIEHFHVSGIPVVVVMDEKGEVLSQTVGLQTKDQIVERLK